MAAFWRSLDSTCKTGKNSSRHKPRGTLARALYQTLFFDEHFVIKGGTLG
jgi:hypothetical protein